MAKLLSSTKFVRELVSASAFTFYRGEALIMASDLSHTPSTGIRVQA